MTGYHTGVQPSPPSHAVAAITLTRETGVDRAALAWCTAEEWEAAQAGAPDFLHPKELAHLSSLTFERRRRSFLLGRWAAKRAVGALLPALSPSQIEVASGVFQQPLLRPGLPDPLGVSVSHSDRLACAVAFPDAHPLAIDVEDTTVDRSAVMTTQMLPRELDEAAAAWRDGDRHAATIWTAKEALSKVLRCGMTCPFTLLAVAELTADAGVRGGRFEHFAQYRFQSWTLGATVLTIVLPRRSTMTIDLAPLERALS